MEAFYTAQAGAVGREVGSVTVRTLDDFESTFNAAMAADELTTIVAKV